MGASLQVGREVDDWASVSRRLRGLESSDFKAEVGKSGSALTVELVVGRRKLWKEFPWNGKALAKHQVGWRCVDIWFDRCTNGQHGAWEAPKPLLRLFGSECDQRLLQPAVEALHHPVCLGMIWSRRDRLDPPRPRQLLENFRKELRSSIRGYGGWDAKSLYPSKREAVDDALGRDVDEWDRNWPSGETVHHC